jgi:hypothetical protein
VTRPKPVNNNNGQIKTATLKITSRDRYLELAASRHQMKMSGRIDRRTTVNSIRNPETLFAPGTDLAG